MMKSTVGLFGLILLALASTAYASPIAEKYKHLFPRPEELNLVNADITIITNRTASAPSTVTQHSISVYAQKDAYLTQGSNLQLRVLVVTHGRRGFREFLDFNSTLLTRSKYLSLIQEPIPQLDGIQYNPATNDNPNKEWFVVSKVSQTLRMSLSFDGKTLSLDTDALKKDLEQGRIAQFDVRIANPILPAFR